MDRFAERLDMMYEIKRRVKSDLKSFNLRQKRKAADKAGLGGEELKFGFDRVIIEMSSRY